MNDKRYLGDGVYIRKDVVRGAYVLTTEDGIAATNTIYLEPEVIVRLFKYWAENMPAPDEIIQLRERFEETKKLLQDFGRED
jgi:hypothetical protein